jgi:hypothetical protein
VTFSAPGGSRNSASLAEWRLSRPYPARHVWARTSEQQMPAPWPTSGGWSGTHRFAHDVRLHTCHEDVANLATLAALFITRQRTPGMDCRALQDRPGCRARKRDSRAQKCCFARRAAVDVDVDVDVVGAGGPGASLGLCRGGMSRQGHSEQSESGACRNSRRDRAPAHRTRCRSIPSRMSSR